MMNLKKLNLIVSLLSLLVVVSANDGSYSESPQGGTIYPINNEYIEMLQELVEYDQRTGKISTTFFFRNTSDKAQEVIIGFPVTPEYFSEDEWFETTPSNDSLMIEIEETIKFKTWINDKPIKRELWKIDTTDKKYKFAFLTTIHFEPLETIKVVNKFNQGAGYGGSNLGDNYSVFSYILETGAYWKGKIGRAVIRFKMEDKPLTKSIIDTIGEFADMIYVNVDEWTYQPEPTTIDTTKYIVEWIYENFEPDFNISIYIHTGPEQIIQADFFDPLDSLSGFIAANNSVGFENYYSELKKNSGYFNYDKSLCKNFYQFNIESLLIEEYKTDPIKIKNKIRHRVNALAALNGYSFSNEMWKKTFELFEWYDPLTKSPKYSPHQLMLILKLKAMEDGELYSEHLEKIKKKKLAKDTLVWSRKSEIENKPAIDRNQVILFAILAIGILSIIILSIIRRKKADN